MSELPRPSNRELSPARRAVLEAVRDGLVCIDEYGCRDYPPYIRGNSLSAAYDRGLWRWPNHTRRPDDVAFLTRRGEELLDA